MVCLLYVIEDERNDDDSGWKVGKHLQTVYASLDRALRYIRRERLVELADHPIRVNRWDNDPRKPYQYRARKTTYNLMEVWVIERAKRGENEKWTVAERYELVEMSVVE